ncbi:MAG: adenylate kinase [Nanoarchaeota archaeon]
MKLVFLGPPGAGKGTQAQLLAESMGIPHISTGEIFRYNLENKTEMGRAAAEYMDNGFLVPDNVTNGMVIDRLRKPDCKNGYILDGYPRTINQAEFLDSINGIDNVIYFSLKDEIAIERLLNRAKESSRSDDTEEVIKKRILVYKDQTQPLLNYYKHKGNLLEIDASSGIKMINRDVKRVLNLS